jgi:hypothetical protein
MQCHHGLHARLRARRLVVERCEGKLTQNLTAPLAIYGRRSTVTALLARIRNEPSGSGGGSRRNGGRICHQGYWRNGDPFPEARHCSMCMTVVLTPALWVMSAPTSLGMGKSPGVVIDGRSTEPRLEIPRRDARHPPNRGGVKSALPAEPAWSDPVPSLTARGSSVLRP